MIALIYCRFSPRRDEEESESIQQQAEFCQAYADKVAWPVLACAFDKAVSGKTLDRPGLWQALSLLEAGDVLLVYKLDRLARDVYGSHVIDREVLKRGARIVSATGEGTWADRPEDRLVRNVLATLNQYQREATAMRTRHAMRRHQKNGKSVSSRAPLGFRLDPDRPGYFIPNPIEQKALKLAYLLRHRKGYSWSKIAAALNQRSDYYTPREKRWYPGSLQRALESDWRANNKDLNAAKKIENPD